MTTSLVYSANHGMYVYTPCTYNLLMSKEDGELRVNKLAYRKQISSQQVKPEKENLLVSTYSTLMKNGSKFGEMKKVSQHSGNSPKVLRAKKAVEQNCNPI